MFLCIDIGTFFFHLEKQIIATQKNLSVRFFKRRQYTKFAQAHATSREPSVRW